MFVGKFFYDVCTCVKLLESNKAVVWEIIFVIEIQNGEEWPFVLSCVQFLLAKIDMSVFKKTFNTVRYILEL